MYTCKLNIYLLGDNCKEFEFIKQVKVENPFTKSIIQSEYYNNNTIDDLNVSAIIINLNESISNKEVNKILLDAKDRTQVVLISTIENINSLEDSIRLATDVWIRPLNNCMMQFNFDKWLANYKSRLDLIETNHFLDATMNNSPNLIWFKTKDGIHEKVNGAFCKTVHKTKEQVQGQGHAYIWDVEADDPACIESEAHVMKYKTQSVSLERIEYAGDKKLLETYKSPLYNLDGTVMGTIGIGMDITEKDKYEKALIKKAREFENLFMNLNCGIISHTIDGERIISVNQEALHILGYTNKEEMLENGFHMVADSVLEEDKQTVINAIKQLENVGDSVSVNYRVMHKDGNIRHVTCNIKLLEEDGELIYQRFVLDCTEQKLDEQEKEKYKYLMFNALTVDYDFVYYHNLQSHSGEIVKLNAKGEVEFGKYTRDNEDIVEGIKKYIYEQVYEEDRKNMLDMLSADSMYKALTTRDIHTLNYKVEYTNGTLSYRQIKIVKVGSWTTRKGIVIGFRDIDNEIQDELRQKELLESALLQANEASLAKSAFIANMSHDMRTPMNAIIGFTNLASTYIDDKDKLKGYFDKIIASSNLLLSLIDGVLDIESIANGKIALAEENCKLSDIMHEIINLTQEQVKNKQLTFEVNAINVVDEEVYCDSLKLKQILLNIISNSIKYTNVGGNINVTIREGAKDNIEYSTYTFIVKDNGIGISPEFLPHIFDAFEREKNTTRSGIQGTGLGMAITKKLVDIMRGNIEIHSEKDKYTEVVITFTFKLNPSENNGIVTIPKLSNSRALIVDSNFTSCDNLSFMLTQIGLRVDFTLSGREAIMRIKQATSRDDSYDVYIIDSSLNDINAIDLIKSIRNTDKDNNSIVIMTGNLDSNVIYDEDIRKLEIHKIGDTPLFLSEIKYYLEKIIKSHAEIELDNAKNAENTKEIIDTDDIMSKPLLLVEDNELNQEIAMEILTMVGFNVEIANNGQEAVNKVVEKGPGYYQLILMDIQMPILNGYDATKAIRELDDPELNSVPILAMTANALEEDRKRAIQSGMNGHIAKPIDVDTLISTLMDAMSKR